MIIAERKPVSEIREMVAPYNKVLCAGCGTCVAVCLAGGEKEARLLAQELELAARAEGRTVETDTACVERQCDMEFLAGLDEKVAAAEAVVSTACGVGIQFLAERYPDKPVFPGVNTTGSGANRDVGWYEERCRSCGECVLGYTAGICPLTMCAKRLFNGPCGGTSTGSCEISPDQPCAWQRIYERLEAQGRLECILKIKEPVEWKNQVPRTTIQPGYRERFDAVSRGDV
ncbi:MAG: methylenetetrahydrofolate reductase C-terminal domain-containing protein [Desulfatibacillaceae bacterium]